MKRTRERFKDIFGRRYPKFLDVKKDRTMLIAGVGDGPQVKIFSDMVKSIVAIDIDDERLRLTNELIEKEKIKNCVVKKLSIYELEKLHLRFDYVLLIDIIEHLDDPKLALYQVQKVLANNGKILITFPCMWEIYYSSGRFLNKHLLKIPEKKGKGYDYHQTKMPPWGWYRLFRKCGYAVVRSNATTMVPPFNWFGVVPVWFSNDVLNGLDSFISSLPLVKNLGLSMMVVLEHG
jgi:SAM-dependent methyltransferase